MEDYEYDRLMNELIKLEDENPELKTKMKNVLMRYSIRNSSIGYC